MYEWVIDTFPDYGNGQVVIWTVDNGLTTSHPEWLADEFSSLSVPPTYVELSDLPIAEKRWQRIFDQWKKKGIVE